MPKSLRDTHTLAIIAVIVLGVLFRMWRLPELFHFTYDEEIIALIGKRIWINQHVPLIGGVTPMHVHLAPYFYWVSGFFLLLSRLDPLGWGVAAALLSGLTMCVLYLVGKQFFDKTAGLFAVLIYSSSFFQNIFDRHWWGLAWNGLISLLTLYSLFQMSQKRYRYTFLLALVLAYGFHTDPSTLILHLFVLFSVVFLKIQIPRKTWVLAVGLYLLSFLPLVIFDVRHDFANSRGIFQFIDEVKNGNSGVVDLSLVDGFLFVPRTLSRILYVFGETNLARQYSYCPQHAQGRFTDTPLLASLSILGLLILNVWYVTPQKKEEKKGLALILLLFISTYVGVTLYGLLFRGDLFDHYLSPLFAAFIMLISFWLNQLRKKFTILAVIILIIYVVSNLKLLVTADHRFGYSDKRNAVRWAIATTGRNDFSLDVVSSCFRYNGYRYLFYFYGKEPVKSYVDANFTYLYDKPPAYQHPPYLVVITNPDFSETDEYSVEYGRYQPKVLTKATFGNIEVLIVDNSQLDFVGKF